jgi:CRP-like cAMP-binding protein
MVVSVETLRKLDFFSGLSEDELGQIAHICEERTCQANALWFEEGEQAEYLYVLLSGKVSIQFQFQLMLQPPYRETAVTTVRPGEPFGWSSLVAPGQYTASARCLEASTAFRIKGSDLKALAEENYRLGYKVMKKIAIVAGSRLRETRQKLIREISQAVLDNW